ncbi:MAG TPA: hypothetical protein VN523_02180 [Hyphomicrobiaceae bacterium]|nr:hypothetical protein [Hyphomicrobiaceae bacterium]
MADSKDETGKGTSRPYATIDLKATEVGAKPAAGAKAASASMRTPWAAALAFLRASHRAIPVLTHVAAGLAGGLLAFLATLLVTGTGGGERGAAPQLAPLAGRVSELERTVGGQSQLPDLRNRVDTLARSTGMLDAASSKHAAELKVLEERLGNGGAVAPELGERLAKLESAITAFTVSGTGETGEAVRSGLDRFERQVAGAKADAARLAERLDRFEQQVRAAQGSLESLKGDLERGLRATARSEDLAPLTGRVAALDKELQAFLKTEADRTANTSRVVLSLELSNLKRAIERGDSFATELAAAKKVAGDRLNLTLFDRYAKEGLPPLSELAASFRKVANGMLDAEAEPADAPLLERLLSGARSIVRVRRSGQAADDGSLEATIARMEMALKESRLGDLLAQGKKLPPKAALVAEDWLRRVEMRYQVEKALADTEAALKSSLAAGPDRRQ